MIDTLAVRSRWLKVRICDLVERHQEQVADGALSHFEHYVGVDHLDAGDVFLRRANPISDGGLPPTFRYAFRRGMLLFPTRRPKLNKYAFAPFDGITGEKILVLKPKASVNADPRFVTYLLSASVVRSWVIEKAIGSITPHFRWRDLADLEIWLPPLDRQVVIANHLVAAYEARESLLGAQAALSVARDSSINTLIYESGFDTEPLDALAEVNPTTKDVTESDPFIAMEDVEAWNRDISQAGLTPRGSRGGVRAKGGDVLMARITPCLENGKIAIVPESIEKCGASTEFIVLRAGASVSREFLYLLVTSKRFHRMATGLLTGSTGRLRVGATDLKRLQVPCLDAEAQARVVAVAREIDSAADQLKRRIENVNALIATVLEEGIARP